MPGYEKLSRIDLLFKGEPWENYEELRMQIAAINTSILDTNQKNINILNHTSYELANARDNSLTTSIKYLKKKIYYGIVVAIEGYDNKNIYIDVPPFNNKTLTHIDNIAKPEVNLEEYEDLVFFPANNFMVSNPYIGGLARVFLPENYPNHIKSNPQDAIYLEMVSLDPLISSDRYAQPSAPTFLKLKGVAGVGGNSTEMSVGESDYGEIPEGQTSFSGVLKGHKKCYDNIHYSWEYKSSGQPTHSATIYNIGRLPGDLFDVKGVEGAVRAYIAMMSAYRTHIKSLSPEKIAQIKQGSQKYDISNPGVRSNLGSFRTYEEQAYLHKTNSNASVEGHSNHESGLAFDIMGTQGVFKRGPSGVVTHGDTYFYDWMKQQAPEFNFRRTDMTESWHWEWRPAWQEHPNRLPYFGAYNTPYEGKCES